MELAVFAVASGHIIETVSVVEAEQAEHRQIDAHADTGRLIQVERIVLVFVDPSLTSLQEGEQVDCRGRIER